nr:uncharacterized protein LOC122269796 [Parasteatoda tepidariorum]
MTDEAKLKTRRGGLRTSATKLMTKIDEALENSNLEYLEVALVQLKEKQMIELDKLIIDKIEDCKQITAEVESSEECRDKIILYKFKIEKILKKTAIEKETVSVESSNTTVSDLFQNSKAQIKIKLPKIYIEKFEGNHENFQEFWSQFRNAIHNNQNLNKIDKFTYLKSLLKSKAQIAIQGLTLSEKNYDIAINILEERYGKK